MPDRIAHYFDRIHPWAMGGGAPFQIRFVVQLLTPDLGTDAARQQTIPQTGALVRPVR
jgi:hypothetical protein